MKILVDTHTHTLASDHAFSTIEENIRQAKRKGLEAIAITDHAPAIEDSPHVWHFDTLWFVPREVEGVKVLYGAEVNILDTDGSIDLPPSVLSKLDVVVASMHHGTFLPQDAQAHTQAYINALKNPYVDIIGHSGSPEYMYDVGGVVALAKRLGKMIEINNQSHLSRRGSTENCRRIAQCCMKLGAYVVVSSDAHVSYSVGEFEEALTMLREMNFPEELIANTSLEKLLGILRQRKLVKGL